jgi:hypothetical protein
MLHGQTWISFLIIQRLTGKLYVRKDVLGGYFGGFVYSTESGQERRVLTRNS